MVYARRNFGYRSVDTVNESASGDGRHRFTGIKHESAWWNFTFQGFARSMNPNL